MLLLSLEVAETRALIFILEDNGLNELAENFLELSYASRKWEKWMIKSTKASDRIVQSFQVTIFFQNPNLKKLLKAQKS